MDSSNVEAKSVKEKVGTGGLCARVADQTLCSSWVAQCTFHVLHTQ